MCKSDQEIHFCSCASIKKKVFPKPFEDVENSRSEYERTEIIWELFHYIGKEKNGMMGEMLMPVDHFNEDMTADFILKKINSKNIFDFEYKPSKGDNLILREEYIYKRIKGRQRQELDAYMSFTNHKYKWKEEVYDVFNHKTIRFRLGLLKPTKYKTQS